MATLIVLIGIILLFLVFKILFAKNKIFHMILFVGIVVLLYFYGQCLSNFVSIRINVSPNDYYIPKESSLCEFKPLSFPDGSGQYWLYGEDKLNYYSSESSNGSDYIYIAHKEAEKCFRFNSMDISTWCTKHIGYR